MSDSSWPSQEPGEAETDRDDATNEDLLPGMNDNAVRPRRKWRRFLIVMSLVVFIPVLVAAGGIYALSEKYLGDIERTPDVFAPIPEPQRPDKPTVGASEDGVTFLVAGVDTLPPAPTTGTQAASVKRGRTDALMLVHFTGDRQRVNVVSIPRDSWVPIPGTGHPNTAKINAAYAYGGPSLAVRTVEKLTDVRIDHFAVVDFAGFTDLTDTLGGVTVTIPEASYDAYRDRRWQAGTVHLSGKDALAYVRQRDGLARGDISRTHRQQQYLKALLGKMLERASLTHPFDLADLIEVATHTVTVDEGLSNGDMRGLLFNLRDVRMDDVAFMTAPVKGLGTEGGGQSVVYLDKAQAKQLWKAFETEKLGPYLTKYGGDTLSASSVN